MNQTRSEILLEVLDLNSEIEDLHDRINDLYRVAEQIKDKDDDLDRDGYLSSIRSYGTVLKIF